MTPLRDLALSFRALGQADPMGAGALPARPGDLTLDSRQVTEGDIFCAVPGTVTDGRAYLAQARTQGAALVLLPEAPSEAAQAALGPLPYRVLPGLAGQLSALAHHYYGAPSTQLRVLGVTGTNGKTSVVAHCAHLLEELGVRTATLGTLGLGFPGSLEAAALTTADPLTVQRALRQMLDAGAEVVAMEVSSHALAQGRVASVAFEAAVMTNLSRDHLDYHGSMAAYGEAKRQLFLQPGLAQAVVNLEDPFCRALPARLPRSVRTLSYALDDRAASVYLSSRQACAQGWQFEGHSPWGAFRGQSALAGAHGLSNLLAALTTLGALGYPLAAMAPALRTVPAAPGRLERFSHPQGMEIFVDYAHTPEALSVALRALRRSEGGRLLCVFGCGGDRDRGKRPLMGAAAAGGADVLFLTNDNPRSEPPEAILAEIAAGVDRSVPCYRIPDRAAALRAALEEAVPGDRILLAGKGHETVQVGAEGAAPFSDRALVADLCAGEGR